MGKRIKITEKSYLEESLSRKRKKSVATKSMIRGLTPHVVEIIIYGFVIFLLSVGTYGRNGIWNSQLELWTNCVKKSPSKERPYTSLGFVFLSQGNYDEAIPHLNEPLRINPNYAEAHYLLGDAYLMMGNRNSALREYGILKTMNPNLANTLYQKIR